jgi:hypothetical protein
MIQIGWQDREVHKQTLSEWLNIGTPVFAVAVSDSQELDDIDEWLREKFSDRLVVNRHVSADT